MNDIETWTCTSCSPNWGKEVEVVPRVELDRATRVIDYLIDGIMALVGPSGTMCQDDCGYTELCNLVHYEEKYEGADDD